MKLQKMADTALKHMVESYSSGVKPVFPIEYFSSIFTGETNEHISDALHLLEHDGFISVFDADGIAYMVSLSPNGIRDCEEDTMIKKGYHCIKEIRQLLPF
ncbi:lactate permease [Clostridiales bacterium TF09-2AC]|nr:lactate permease [Clostridiales bacterium TF09-2AC]